MRAWVLFLAALLMCSPASAESVKKEFERAWSERADQRAAAETIARTANQRAFDDMIKAAEEKSSAVRDKVEAAFAAARDLGYATGRNAAMRDFQHFLASKPSAERAEMWMQEQADTIARLSQKQSEKLSALNANPQASGYFLESLAFVATSATIKGASDELNLISENLATYFQAKNEESRRRRARLAAIFGAIGQSMQSASSTPPPPPPSTVTTHCRTFGGVTSCTSN